MMNMDNKLIVDYEAPVAESVEVNLEGPVAESNPGGVTPEIPDNPA